MKASMTKELITKELIGKKYPIKNHNNNIVGFRTITGCHELHNYFGFVISLGGDPSILINIKEANEILDGKYQELTNDLSF